MKIAVNERFLSRQVTGMERYVREILGRLDLGDCPLSNSGLRRSLTEKGQAGAQSFTRSRSAGMLREVYEKCQ